MASITNNILLLPVGKMDNAKRPTKKSQFSVNNPIKFQTKYPNINIAATFWIVVISAPGFFRLWMKLNNLSGSEITLISHISGKIAIR